MTTPEPAPDVSAAPASRLAAFRERLHQSPRLRRALLGLAAVLLVAGGAVGWLLLPFLKAFGNVGAGPEDQPSRLYGAPAALAVGQEIDPEELAGELEELGYHPAGKGAVAAGRFRQGDDSVAVRLRRSAGVEGPVPGRLLTVDFARGRRGRTIRQLRVNGQPVERTLLTPPVLATYYGEEAREIWPVTVAALPEHVVQAVLAAEDASFYWHPGVSPTGIARALLVNVRRGEVAQGGSTLTQQLVKNVFLTHERSLFRKVREAVIALAVEATHSKREILQGYLNQIYLGGGGGIQFYGIGTAARAYFGKDAADLTLPEAALIAGMIKAPAVYSPLQHPEKAKAQRDAVLRRMAELEWIDAPALEQALAASVETAPMSFSGRPAPHFADAMAAEARERFGLSRLGNRGYQLFGTLPLRDQKLAQEAVRKVLDELDRPRRRRKGEPLEAALVSVDPKTGALLAYVGGRDYARSEFDRVSQARRQAGSAFKPIVLVAALETGKYSPATLLADEPLTLKTGAGSWTPKNADGTFRGKVTARSAIEGSRNVPLVRLAMDLGLPQVIATARKLGITGPLEEVPSLALGAAEVTPREMATVYSTLANGGLRPGLHGLEAVRGPRGKPIAELKPAKAERAVSPQVAFLTTSVLEGVIRWGTGRGVSSYRISGPVAGKTGTTNEARDSWFAGYRPDRVTVVWVGHDNPESTALSGSRAALPIWGRYMKTLPEADDDLEFAEPPGIDHAWICRSSGLLSRSDCPRKIEEVFLAGQKPKKACALEHAPPVDESAETFGLRLGSWLKDRLDKVLSGLGEEEEPP